MNFSLKYKPVSNQNYSPESPRETDFPKTSPQKVSVFHAIILAFSLFATSCQMDELVYPTLRLDCYNRNKYDSSTEYLQSPDRIDTCLYFCAIDFEPSYNWVKDSSYGSVNYKLIFYKDYVPILEIPSSSNLINSQADTHHIINGQLYTESTAQSHTIIARNGEELFRFESKELLKGIVPLGEDVYTLSQNRSGSGFSLRCNGEIIMSSEIGTIIGDLCDPSYADTGALYIDMDKLCFSYFNGSKLDPIYYTVIDGQLSELRGTQYSDIKIINGLTMAVSERLLSYNVSEARLWRTDILKVSAFFSNLSTSFMGICQPNNSTDINRLTNAEAVVYVSNEAVVSVYQDRSGELKIDSDLKFEPPEAYKLLNPKCAILCGTDFYAGLSPSNHKEAPVLLSNNSKRNVGVHGFISDISVYIGPP